MRIGSWLIHLVTVLLVLILAAVGAGGWFLYRQDLRVSDMSEGLNLLMLRAERLEYLVQEQETREILAQEETKKAKKVEEEAKKKLMASRGEDAKPVPEPTSEPTPTPEPEPQVSDVVAVKNIRQDVSAGELIVSFDMTNTSSSGESADGYVSVLLKGAKDGEDLVETWPPMRLDDRNRPLNYRRGTPFAVQRYRRIKARFPIAGKQPKELQFLVFSREGSLLLVVNQPITAEAAPR